MTFQRKRILICPLDWGIGHAARCIPIIKTLNTLGHDVVVAASGGGKALLMRQFPQNTIIDFPSFNIKYSYGKHLWWKLLLQMPAFILSIVKEHRALQSLIRQYRIDGLISDNRFGCWTSLVPTVYITHQVNLISPMLKQFLSPLLASMHQWIIRQYDECWIPDLPDPSNGGLAGSLSHPPAKNTRTRYIGLLSRFDRHCSDTNPKSDYLLAILSGPEPQRSLLEQKIIKELAGKSVKIIRGLPDQDQIPPPNTTFQWFNHADDALFEQLVCNAQHILCRSGYSTLMDLVALGRTAHLIPTPGQSEQEYLARHLSSKGYFTAQHQSERLNIPKPSPDNASFSLSNETPPALVQVLTTWVAHL